MSSRSGIGRPSVPVDQAGPKPAERPRQPRLHRPLRDPQRVGRLRLGEVEEIARANDLAVVVPEEVQRGDQRRPRLVGEDRRLGRWSRITQGAVLGGTKHEPGSPPGGAAAVARFVRDDPKEPRPERGTGPEPGQRRVRLDEGLLSGVLGVPVGRDHVRGTDGHVLVAADQLLVGHDLAFAGAFDQFGVFQWTALHGQPYLLHPAAERGSRSAPDRLPIGSPRREATRTIRP